VVDALHRRDAENAEKDAEKTLSHTLWLYLGDARAGVSELEERRVL